MPQDRERSLVESPGWMVLCIVWSGWSAASTGSPLWVRLGCLVLFVAFVALLLRHVVKHHQNGKSRLS
ncbi:hypothetical protein JL475_23145 [Streptomyces sp. M2CJ-2]|uniref:hypothetical protein n=1 Tax=Streptomyces sp. M2CJ-2 TaxID=2803948 RepID=UPI0019297808|nr:hypothetical protein [Streptomyces sp. M2CJ-2]MBL3668839.1 hypothetical protein [Streptomyces sp. M2CJ-2]